ncbi:MAG: pitrilysin family protein [Planctomycetota bacterium]|nr:pitrilysin family protein [Planctomycetota bacterium]
MEFKQTKFENGLTIVAEVNPAAASMAAGFFVRTGSRDETSAVSGVSHFLEHMMFKGTKRRSAFDVNREFDEMGASYNAFTSEENTVYFAAVLPEFQARILDLLCDIMRPALRAEDFEVEKKVILDEIARYQDIPQFRVYDKLMSEHFAGHPLGNSILGVPESITALKRDDMQAYFDCRYSPGNVTVVGVGNLDFDAFVQAVGETCSKWPCCGDGRETSRASVAGAEKVISDKKVLREHIGLMSSAPSGQDEARYAAQLAAAIVGDLTGSRLFYALVDPAIADEASMAYNPMDGEGAFLTFISSDADRAAEAVRLARAEFRSFVEQGPADAELLAAKNKIASAATLKGELPMGRLTAVGFDWVYCKEYVPLAQQIEKLFAVTKQDICEVVRRYDLTAATMLALGPLETL